jgi:hypothetical protein
MKLKMDNQAIAASFFEDTHLLGIVAPVKDYHFCWQLNRLLHFNFRINTDMEIEIHKKDRLYYFCIYEFNIPDSALKHYIYVNQFDGEFLLPEFRHLDFLWLIKGEWLDPKEVDRIIGQIKKINQVQLVTVLTNEKIRNKENLVF